MLKIFQLLGTVNCPSGTSEVITFKKINLSRLVTKKQLRSLTTHCLDDNETLIILSTPSPRFSWVLSHPSVPSRSSTFLQRDNAPVGFIVPTHLMPYPCRTFRPVSFRQTCRSQDISLRTMHLIGVVRISRAADPAF